MDLFWQGLIHGRQAISLLGVTFTIINIYSRSRGECLQLITAK